MWKKYAADLEGYKKDRALWLAQQKAEKKLLSEFPAYKRKVDVLCARFDQHLTDEKAARETDRVEREARQKEHDERMARIEGNIQQILDIKRSTEMVLKFAKWTLGLLAAVATILKIVFPFIKHKIKGG